jgi:hypothetical protein
MKGTIMIGNNNLSRTLFKEFLERNLLERPSKRDSRNVVQVGDSRWVFTIGDAKEQCRQFYDDCDRIYIHGEGTVLREDCDVGAITRIAPNGMIARNASYANSLVSESIFK